MEFEEFGLDEVEEKREEKVVEFEKPKKRPYYVWKVGGEEYKLKLDSASTCRLEDKFKRNLLNVISVDGIPQLGIMLTIIQAALLKYQHSLTFEKVQRLYDKYIEEGGNQMKLYSDVIMGIMAVSGFFTTEQAEAMQDKLETASQLL